MKRFKHACCGWGGGWGGGLRRWGDDGTGRLGEGRGEERMPPYKYMQALDFPGPWPPVFLSFFQVSLEVFFSLTVRIGYTCMRYKMHTLTSVAFNTCGHRVSGCSNINPWFLGEWGRHLFYNMAAVGWQTVICSLVPHQANAWEVCSPKSTSLWPQLANTKQLLCHFVTPDVKHCMRHQWGWCTIWHSVTSNRPQLQDAD